jgi:hypothetical protein
MEERIEAYFDLCKNTPVEVSGKKEARLQKPPTMEGLCAYLGLSKKTLLKYLSGGYESADATERAAVADCLERAQDRLTAETLEGALLGRYDARICAMILNGMGYTGKETQQSGHLSVQWENVGAAELKQWAE